MSESYGNESCDWVAGRLLPYSSDAERDFISNVVAPMMQSGEITYFVWQPREMPLFDKKGRLVDPYRPDAFIRWDNGEEWYIEVKRGRIEQISAHKMKLFCLEYPNKKLVLAWFGRIPTRGPTKRRLDTITPHLHHIWYVK